MRVASVAYPISASDRSVKANRFTLVADNGATFFKNPFPRFSFFLFFPFFPFFSLFFVNGIFYELTHSLKLRMDHFSI